MGKYELYENFFVRVGTNGNTDVILNFYEFLDVEPMAKKSEIFNAYQKKSSEFLKNIDIDLQEKQKERKTLDRVYSCLLYDDKNRQIYDERLAKIKEKNMLSYKKFFNAMKKYKIERTNKEIKIKDASDFKKKIIQILAVVAALGIFAGGTANYVNNINDEPVSDNPTTSASEFYTDADGKMETIEYLVEADSDISGVADIAVALGIPKDQCIQVGNIKIGDEGVIYTVSVPEDIAKKYNAKQEEKDRLKVKKHFVCDYKTPNKFNSLVSVAQEIVGDEDFSGFKEGKEYTRDGRTPANQLAKDMIRDNPNMGTDLQHAQSGDYELYFYGTDEEYEDFVKQGKLPKPNNKSISQN